MAVDRERLADEFFLPAAANALGTLVAALVIFIVGVAAGVIVDVPARVWVSIGGAALGVAVGAATSIVSTRARREAREAASRARAAEVLADLDFDEHLLLMRAIGRTSGPPLDAEETDRLLAALLRRRPEPGSTE